MTAIAIDDELVALQVIKSHASKVPFLDLKEVFTNAFDALEYLQKNSVDLIFLDIKMPDISGIEFYKSLHYKPLVIFTTAYQEHAVTSFELDAVDYLLKPFSLVRFIKGCNKASELFNLRNAGHADDFLFIKTGTDQIRISLSDILYIEAAGNYVTYFLNDRQVLARSTVAETLATLPSNQFLRVHRSYIVAVNKISRISRDEVEIGKKKIPVSEAYRQELNEFLKSK
jgi:two-component system LytT family response regulator